MIAEDILTNRAPPIHNLCLANQAYTNVFTLQELEGAADITDDTLFEEAIPQFVVSEPERAAIVSSPLRPPEAVKELETSKNQSRLVYNIYLHLLI